MLEDYVDQHPDDTRCQFYLGLSYKDAGHYLEALEAYKTCVSMEGGYDEEAFYSQLEIGKLTVNLGMDEDSVTQEFLAASEMRPTTAEPLNELSRYFDVKEMYAKVFVFATAGAQMAVPLNDSLPVATSLYQWKLLDELCTVAFYANQMSSGRSACEEIIHRVDNGIDIGEDNLRCVRENLRFFY